MSKEIADIFRRMADRIEKNAAEPFGGCALIIPPVDIQNTQQKPTMIEMLKLDPNSDFVIFWGEIKSKADQAVVEYQNATRRGVLR
jgi:hypothetical protein